LGYEKHRHAREENGPTSKKKRGNWNRLEDFGTIAESIGKFTLILKNLEPENFFSGNLEPMMVKYIHMEPKKKPLEPLQWN